jgi:hypothetical protein
MQYMKAKQLVRRKEVRADGSIIEIVIWELPEPITACKHRFKYRLAYVVAGICVVRYDNERGKGDHRHVGSVESPYCFSGIAELLVDFRNDVEGWK